MTARFGPPTPTRNYWISWYSAGPFEYHGPWWISGYRLDDNAATICAAVAAITEGAARAVIAGAHDDPPAHIEWRFADERPHDWTPFSDRFPRADWMQWPWPAPDPAWHGTITTIT